MKREIKEKCNNEEKKFIRVRNKKKKKKQVIA